MKIKKRDGRLEQLSFDKVIYRLKKLCNDLSLGVLTSIDPDVVAQRVVSSIYDGVTSCELDEEAARIAISMTENPEYQKLASRIIVSNAHKSTHECFSEVMERLYGNTDKAGNLSPILADDTIETIRKHKNTLNFAIDYKRDYLFDYFGYKTLERSYLQKVLNKTTNAMEVVERPQHLYMRVAVGIHKDNIEAVLKTYDLISQHYYTHASPTLFNGGTQLNQYSSCFLVGTCDSLEGIFKTITDCGKISKLAGGIGVHITNIRAKGSLIRGTNGPSDGIIPMIKVYNEVAKYINQGGKRKGSFACFVKDTKVCTVNDGVKNIQDIEIGDLVVTHKNRVRPVEQIHKNELGDRKIYKVSVIGNKDIYVTGNHKFWSFYTKKYKKNKLSFGWNSVEDLKTLIDNKKTSRQSCYVSMPTGTNIQNDTEYIIDIMDYKDILLNEPPIVRLTSCKNDEYEKITPISESFDKNNNLKISHGQSINRKWIVNDDLANLFGIWLGDGHIKKNKNYIRGIGFTVHNINKKLINYIINTSKKIFGCNITSYNSKNSNVTNVCINSHIVGKIFMTLFGSYFNGKRLPKMIFSWPKNLVNNLLAGLITTDGHISKKKSNITLGLSNEELMNQIYHLCRNNGIKTSYLNKYIGKGQSCYNYVISINSHKDIIDKIYKLYDDNRMQNCSLDNSTDYEFIKILSITETDRSDEYVYTLGVKDDHSYTVEGLLVENCYLEPWHADVLEFLDLKKNQGHEDLRARDLFYSMWVPDLFMKCVEDDGDWYLMCPDECPGLTDVYGDKFESLYNKYVEEKRYKRVVKAQEVWTKILDAQIETGTPYIGYKDAVNKKCNQKNLGTIRSSNLCTEISLYSDDKEYGVCNLASIALPKYVTYDEDGNPHFDFEHLRQVSEYIIGPMNDVIDNNYYPVPETKLSNMRHRPIGIGVQGLVDVYVKMRLPFESEGAKKLNKEIFETIYYGCLTGSVNAAKLHGHYSSFPGSPFSEAKLQFDLAKEFDGINLDDYLSGRWDWDSLKTDLVKYGARNSMLLALMPTASTAQIMGNSEAFEPVDSCIFKRRVLSGEYIVVNKYLVEDLVKLGLWSKELKDTIIANDGSIQNIDAIPDDLKALYKTVWEISMKSVIEQARDRGVFVDQMQSMNLFMANPNYKRLTSMHFYAWKANLKTGMYYLRSKSSYAAGKFSIDANLEKTIREKRERGEELKREEEEAVLMCSRENPEACMLCSS